jgi:hypothetical protein
VRRREEGRSLGAWSAMVVAMRNECHRGGVGRTARTRRGGGDRQWYYEEEGWRPHTHDVGVWGQNFLVIDLSVHPNIFSTYIVGNK